MLLYFLGVCYVFRYSLEGVGVSRGVAWSVDVWFDRMKYTHALALSMQMQCDDACVLRGGLPFYGLSYLCR